MNKILCEINPIYPVKDILPNGKDIYDKTTIELCKREILDAMMYSTVYAVENNERIRFTERDKVDYIINQVIKNRNISTANETTTPIVKAFDTIITEEPKDVVEVEEEVLYNTDEVVSVDIKEEPKEENSNSIPYKNIQKNNKNTKKK